MDYPINSSVKKSFVKMADKRGYDESIKADYVKERTQNYRTAAKQGDAITLTVLAGTAGKILHDSKGKKVIETAKKQIKPLIDVIDNGSKRMAANFAEKSIGKQIVSSLKEGVKLPFEVMKGMYKSVPKALAIPAVALMAIGTAAYHLNNTKTDAKFDAVQYMRDSQES